METELFGRRVTFEYSERWIGDSLLVMRVAMGWVLFRGGVTKLVTYLDADPGTTGPRRDSWRTRPRRGTRSRAFW